LKEHGIEPAPERSRKTKWKEFITRLGTRSWHRSSSRSRCGRRLA
jgi:hypothetical protein